MSSSTLIFSDLDGTLLDHYSYEFTAALPALGIIQQKNIPLILNSSKTAPEMKQICELLTISFPFIVENGAGIYLPIDDNKQLPRRYDIKSFGMDRAAILKILQDIRTEFGYSFNGFADMSADELRSKTGLSKEQAELAKDRDYSEPLIWLGHEQEWQDFVTLLQQHDLRYLQGGRFITVSGSINKSGAMLWLCDFYGRDQNAKPLTIALGDSENDVAMLEAADYPILVRSPAHPLPKVKHDNLIITEEYGPQGWNNSLLALLDILKLEK